MSTSPGSGRGDATVHVIVTPNTNPAPRSAAVMKPRTAVRWSPRASATADEATRRRVQNRGAIHAAWRLHASHVRHSLEQGFYQGWDLHPAQLPSRYATLYAFFLEGVEAASERLLNFVGKAAQATLVGEVFDDAATGQGLLNYFLRAMSCGALSEEDAVRRSGLTLDELRSRSFVAILRGRRA